MGTDAQVETRQTSTKNGTIKIDPCSNDVGPQQSGRGILEEQRLDSCTSSKRWLVHGGNVRHASGHRGGTSKGDSNMKHSISLSSTGSPGEVFSSYTC
jgi:hypothetical protein